MDLKEKVMGNVITILATKYDTDDLQFIRNVLSVCFQSVEFCDKKDLPSEEVFDDEKIVKRYFATKKMEGLSDKSLKLYKYHIDKFFNTMQVPIIHTDTNTIRYYLATLSTSVSKSYTDHARRILNTFFEFCKDEEYIRVNPVKKIKHIKQDKTMKEPYNDIEVELLRDSCITPREKALVSFLFATGARRDEICKLKIQDINLYDRSAIVHGKGGKDRIVYFSARCEKHIREYILSKKYTSDYLFSSEKSPHGKLSNNGLANIVKRVGTRANVSNVHLHRFRRWFGTYMANQGIPLQDLKEMLGHEKIETTNTYYVHSNTERIRLNHKKHAA